jgi:myo-inositol-1(or 4)-monophosphatase
MNYNAIVKLVYDARKIALNAKLRKDFSMKGEADYVTAVDTAISEFIKNGLKEIAPDYAFVTEEESEHVTAGKRFILDPIDGTTNLVRGYNQCSISLACYCGDEVKFGVVYSPFSGETFFAVKGKGAHFYNARNGVNRLLKIGVENYTADRLAVSKNLRQDAIVEFGAGSTNKIVAEESFRLGEEIFKNCMDLRRICSSALSLCYIAAGRIDGYFERKLKVWDYAAAALILEEAGGALSQWNGERLPFTEPSTIVAGNVDTYAYLLKILKDR